MRKFIIKDTKKYGKGVFANKKFKKGTYVHLLKGKKIDVHDMVDLIVAGKEHIDNPLQVGRRTHLELDKLSIKFNHSCDPNCGIKKNNQLFALRDIYPGEELTYDYSTTVAPTEWKMRCKCGSQICRKFIGDVLSIPSDRLKLYQKQKALPTYIKKLLKEIKTKKYLLPAYERRAIARLKLTTD